MKPGIGGETEGHPNVGRAKNLSDRDISKSIEAEDELQRARQLESIAALSGGIAHDYNNLLTVIIGNVSLIQSYVDPQDMVYRLLNEVNEAALVAKSLTQKLITFSRGGAPLKETTDMAALVRSVAEFSLSGSNIKCQFDVADDLWLVDVDKTQVSQAVHNLVMNAREAMPEGGVITVSAGNVQNIDGEHVSTAVRWVRLSIIDRGQGIAPENMDKDIQSLFFHQATRQSEGDGPGPVDLPLHYSKTRRQSVGRLLARFGNNSKPLPAGIGQNLARNLSGKAVQSFDTDTRLRPNPRDGR